ncbi:MAG: hypothetical protein JW384_03854 [Nitrosomonadaceae bacterium]|nr:hypothetical protein [Nitrosomonadaceae bacterium]
MTFDLEELFIINEHVRQARTAPQYGEEHSAELRDKLFTALTFLWINPNITQAEVVFDKYECLLITRQIAFTFAIGSRPIGREILKKVIMHLTVEETPSKENIDVPTIFLNAFDANDNADSNS